jgi:hypothetical protein
MMRELGRLSACKVMCTIHTHLVSKLRSVGLVNQSLSQLHKRQPDELNLERAPHQQRGVAVTLWAVWYSLVDTRGALAKQ